MSQARPKKRAVNPPSQSRAIEPATDGPRRREADKLRRQYLKQLESAQRSAKRFEEEDVPAFEQWKAATFGSRLTALRDSEEELRRLQILIDDVEEERHYYGGSFQECYERVLFYREHPKEADEQGGFEEEFREESDAFFKKAFGQNRAKGKNAPPPDFAQMEQEVREMFADFLGIDIDPEDPAFKRGFEEYKRMFGFDGPPGEDRPGAPKNGSAAPGLKQAYRALARKLHPDHREELDALSAQRLDELWHETQEAYAHGQIEELQRIEALIDIEANGVTERTDPDRLEQIAEKHRQSLRALQRSLRQFRDHPAWMFSKKPKAKIAIARQIEWELSTLTADVMNGLAYCNRIIDKWKKAAAPRKPKKTRTRQSQT